MAAPGAARGPGTTPAGDGQSRVRDSVGYRIYHVTQTGLVNSGLYGIPMCCFGR